jgi:hypothetical protein
LTGEVVNYSDHLLAEIPVRVTLSTAEGRVITDASDMVMGHGIAPVVLRRLVYALDRDSLLYPSVSR